MQNYAQHDGLGLAELVRKRDVTPAELLDAAIQRIERHNGSLNAVVYKAYDEARAVASGPLPDGPFKGVPFLIKDLGVRVKNWPRTSASRFARIDADADDQSADHDPGQWDRARIGDDLVGKAEDEQRGDDRAREEGGAPGPVRRDGRQEAGEDAGHTGDPAMKRHQQNG